MANFTKGWMYFYNREFGTQLAVEDSQRWGDPVNLTHFPDINEFWEWTSDLDGRSLFWHLEPFPGALEAVRSLADAGHDIIIVTMKPNFAVEDTHEWVGKHQIPAAEVHILEDKWRIKCDVYLDDAPHILAGLVRHRPEATVCRYIRPWNRPIAGVIDVNDFVEFREVVDRLVNSEDL